MALVENSKKIEREMFSAYAPPKKVEPPKRTASNSDKHVDPEVLQAFRPPHILEKHGPSQQTIPAPTQQPIGGCAHPFDARWSMDEGLPTELEGCLRCRLANNRGHWEANELWVASAKKIGILK